MKGDGPVYENLTDLRVKVQVIKGTIVQVAKQISPYLPKDNFVGNKLKILLVLLISLLQASGLGMQFMKEWRGVGIPYIISR